MRDEKQFKKLAEIIRETTKHIIYYSLEEVKSDMEHYFPRILDWMEKERIGAGCVELDSNVTDSNEISKAMGIAIGRAFEKAYEESDPEYLKKIIVPAIVNPKNYPRLEKIYKESLKQIQQKSLQEIKQHVAETDAFVGKPIAKIPIEKRYVQKQEHEKPEIKRVKDPSLDISTGEIRESFKEIGGDYSFYIPYTDTVKNLKQAVDDFVENIPEELKGKIFATGIDKFIMDYDGFMVEEGHNEVAYQIINLLKNQNIELLEMYLKNSKRDIENYEKKYGPIIEIFEKNAIDLKKYWENLFKKFRESGVKSPKKEASLVKAHKNLKEITIDLEKLVGVLSYSDTTGELMQVAERFLMEFPSGYLRKVVLDSSEFVKSYKNFLQREDSDKIAFHLINLIKSTKKEILNNFIKNNKKIIGDFTSRHSSLIRGFEKDAIDLKKSWLGLHEKIKSEGLTSKQTESYIATAYGRLEKIAGELEELEAILGLGIKDRSIKMTVAGETTIIDTSVKTNVVPFPKKNTG